jgi:hypothetical protein
MMYKRERFHRTVGTVTETTRAVDRRAETSLWPSRLHERFAYLLSGARDDRYIGSSTGDECGLEIAVDVGDVEDVSLVREKTGERSTEGRVS